MGIKIDITPKDLKTVKDLLKQYLPNTLVWAFGSRVKFTAKPTSDLDLVAFISKEQELKFSLLKEALEESSVPFRIDLHNWNELPETFHKNIESSFVVLQEDAKKEMPSEWKTYKLGEIASFISRGVTPSYSDDGVIVINQKCIRDGKVSFEQARFTNPILKNISNDKYLQSFDILINSTGQGTLGRVGQVKEIMQATTVDSHVTIVRASDKINPIYLGYYLKSKQALIESLAEGSTGQTELTRQKVAEIQIQAPDLRTQKEIAQILSSLDDKIEINLQMNQTLEAMAQAIFKEWFVNFNFPGSESEKRKVKSEKSDELSTFHSSLITANGLPKGWRIERFDNHFEVVRGLSYKGSGLATKENGIPMYNLNSVYEGGGFKYEGIKFYNGEYKDKHLVRPRDIIVANTEQGHKYLLIGFPAVVPYYFGDTAIFSHHIYRVRPNEDSYLTPQFIYYLILQQEAREQIIGCSNGTTVNMLKIDGLQMPEFKLPPPNLIQQFSEIIEPVWQRQENNFAENQSLIQLRDTLLPKLMSGQIPIPA